MAHLLLDQQYGHYYHVVALNAFVDVCRLLVQQACDVTFEYQQQWQSA